METIGTNSVFLHCASLKMSNITHQVCRYKVQILGINLRKVSNLYGLAKTHAMR